MDKKSVFQQFIAHIVILTLLTSSVAVAQEPPDREQVAGTINQDAQVQLVISGNNVETEQKQDEQHDAGIESENKAAVEQAATVDANTGNNEASRNISIGGNAGAIQTGNIGVVSQAAVGANTNTTAAPGGGTPSAGSGSGSAINAVNSGDNVSANANTNNATNTSVQNANDAAVNQNTNVNANTGNNRADRNISIGGSAGVINTGSVGVSTYYLAVPNRNATLVGGSNSNGNGPGSGASIQLANAGDDVATSSNTSNTSTVGVQNLNESFVNQLTTVNANTGNNTANRNIAFGGDAGVIYTGNIGVGVTYVVDGNENRTAASDGSVPGASVGSTTDVANSGDKVSTSSDSSTDSSMSVSNANKTYITQTAFINANTGNNVASRNISYGGTAGGISTGSVGVNVQFIADFSKNTIQVYPTTTYYLPAAVGHVVTSPTPTFAPQRQQAMYHYSQEQPEYIYYPARQAVRSPYATYSSAPSAVMGAYAVNPVYGNNAQAQVAVQESRPQSMSLGGLSQLMIMLISLGALGLRKMVRV